MGVIGPAEVRLDQEIASAGEQLLRHEHGEG